MHVGRGRQLEPLRRLQLHFVWDQRGGFCERELFGLMAMWSHGVAWKEVFLYFQLIGVTCGD